MARFRRLVCTGALALGVLATAATAASASTFYVNARNGTPSSKCGVFPGGKPGEHEEEDPCLTIASALKKAEAAAPPNTIELSTEGPGPSGEYNESVTLEKAQDAGLTINGEEAGVEIVGNGAPALKTKSAAGSVTLSNLKLLEAGGSTAAIVDEGARLTLDEALVENESGKNGIEVSQLGSLTMNGGRVEMENGASGFAIEGFEGALALSGVTILNGSESQAEAGGVNSERSTLSMTNRTSQSNLGSVRCCSESRRAATPRSR